MDMLQASSVREARQPRTWAWKLVTRHVQLHRQEGVVAADASHIDHALLAETLLGSIGGRVRNALIFLKLGRKIVDDLFIGAHAVGRRPSAIASAMSLAIPALSAIG